MKKITRVLGAAVFCLVVSMAVNAQDAPIPEVPVPVDESALILADTSETSTALQGSALWPYIFRMIIVLGLVIAVIYGLYAIIRRSSRIKTGDDAYLKILATTPLAPGKSMHVVALGTRSWLLASTDAAVTVVSEIDDRELIDTLSLRAAAAPEAPRTSFGSVLAGLLRPGQRRPSSTHGSADFLAKQRNRLKGF